MSTATEAEPDIAFPIFDTLDRLLSAGWKIEPPEIETQLWHLYSPHGSAFASGASFRELCVNIVLMEL